MVYIIGWETKWYLIYNESKWIPVNVFLKPIGKPFNVLYSFNRTPLVFEVKMVQNWLRKCLILLLKNDPRDYQISIFRTTVSSWNLKQICVLNDTFGRFYYNHGITFSLEIVRALFNDWPFRLRNVFKSTEITLNTKNVNYERVFHTWIWLLIVKKILSTKNVLNKLYSILWIPFIISYNNLLIIHVHHSCNISPINYLIFTFM